MTVYLCQAGVELITVKQDKSVLLQNGRNWSHSSAEKKRPCLSEALSPKLSWSWDWCEINPGEKIQQVTSIFWDKWNDKEFYRSLGNDFPLLLSSMQYEEIESTDNLNKWGRLSIPAEAAQPSASCTGRGGVMGGGRREGSPTGAGSYIHGPTCVSGEVQQAWNSRPASSSSCCSWSCWSVHINPTEGSEFNRSGGTSLAKLEGQGAAQWGGFKCLTGILSWIIFANEWGGLCVDSEAPPSGSRSWTSEPCRIFVSLRRIWALLTRVPRGLHPDWLTCGDAGGKGESACSLFWLHLCSETESRNNSRQNTNCAWKFVKSWRLFPHPWGVKQAPALRSLRNTSEFTWSKWIFHDWP